MSEKRRFKIYLTKENEIAFIFDRKEGLYYDDFEIIRCDRYEKLLEKNKELEEENKRLMSYFKDILYGIERDNNHSYINVSIARKDYQKFEDILTEKKWDLGLL